MSKELLCILLFFFFSCYAFGQKDLSGLWVGKVTQEEGGYAPSYTFEIFIKHEGNKIEGRSYVFVDQIYASFEMSGSIHSGIYLSLKDSELLDNKVNEGMEWCLKKYQLVLKVKDGKYHLEGFWQGKTSFSTCIPGKVFLEKKVPRA
ncbi:MAG: hypothetical protein AAF573_03820 [Bacteroidota bacterium]